MMDRIAISVEARPDLSGADPFHRDPAEPTTADALSDRAAADRQHRLGDGDGLLHQLGLDRAAHRPRAAAGADPGDDRHR